MPTHDFFLKRDTEQTELVCMEDCKLIIHGGQLQEQHRERLQKEEERRIESKGRGRLRSITAKDAKNDAKSKKAMPFQNAQPDYPALEVPFKAVPPTKYSILLRFTWITKSPFFSRALDEFSTIDNPITRDTLTNLPVLHASGAKGMLRSLLTADLSADTLKELFGNDREIKNQEDAYAGIVVPGDVVFHSKTKTEVFSPHERKTQAAKLPVSFEVVPAGVPVNWDVMLYDFRNTQTAMAQNAATILCGVKDLITEIGLSAKRSSGLGMGKDLKVKMISGGGFPAPNRDLPIDEAIKVAEGWK